MFDQATLTDSHSAISSLESAFGATHFAVPNGGTTDLFGQVPVRANLSARQAKELGLMTSGTYGRISNGSSKSASLQSSLESKLQARLSMTGSTLYTLTWKPWVTPSGVSRSRLRASVRRTSETATIGSLLPVSPRATPAARDWVSASGSPEFLAERAQQSRGKPLSEQVFTLCGWPTPTTADGSGGGQAKRAMGETRHGSNLNDFAMLTGWPTPTSTDAVRSPGQEFTTPNITLNHAAVFAGWGTPLAQMANGTPEAFLERKRKSVERGSQMGISLSDLNMQVQAYLPGPARLTATGVMLTGSAAGMESGGQLNPAHSRWLQGLPPEWCACAAMAMQLMPKLQKRGSKP